MVLRINLNPRRKTSRLTIYHMIGRLPLNARATPYTVTLDLDAIEYSIRRNSTASWSFYGYQFLVFQKDLEMLIEYANDFLLKNKHRYAYD